MKELKCITKPIAVWGTGINALKAMYYIKKNGKSIDLFVQNNSTIDEFCGKNVKTYSQLTDKNKYFYIIGTSFNSYIEISKQIQSDGFVELKDFIYWEWIDKKIIYIHGNCHFFPMIEMLHGNEKFNDNYIIYPFVPIYKMKPELIPYDILKHVDVWIHQDIRTNNTIVGGEIYSDEYMRRNFRDNILEVVVPNLFGMGNIYFPQVRVQLDERNPPISNGKIKDGMFCYADDVIDSCVKKEMCVDDIIKYCVSMNTFDTKEVVNNFNIYFNKIKNREQNWNIIVSDFILKNFKKQKLFLDVGHPSNVLLQYIVNRIMWILGLDGYIELKDTYSDLDDYELPIYPKVKEILKLEFDENDIRKSSHGKKMDKKMSFEEYIREYLYWCYKIC